MHGGACAQDQQSALLFLPDSAKATELVETGVPARAGPEGEAITVLSMAAYRAKRDGDGYAAPSVAARTAKRLPTPASGNGSGNGNGTEQKRSRTLDSANSVGPSLPSSLQDSQPPSSLPQDDGGAPAPAVA